MGSVTVFLSSLDVVVSSCAPINITPSSLFTACRVVRVVPCAAYIADEFVALGGDDELGGGELDRDGLEDGLELVAEGLGAVARLGVLEAALDRAQVAADGVQKVKVVRRREGQRVDDHPPPGLADLGLQRAVLFAVTPAAVLACTGGVECKAAARVRLGTCFTFHWKSNGKVVG